MSGKSKISLSEIRGRAEGLIKELGVVGAAKKLGVNRSTMWRWKKGRTTPEKSNISGLDEAFKEGSVMFFRAKYIIHEEKTEKGELFRRVVDRGYLSVSYHFIDGRDFAREGLLEEIKKFRAKCEISNFILKITKIEEVYKHLEDVKGLIRKKELTIEEQEQRELLKWKHRSESAKKRKRKKKRRKHLKR